MRLAILCLSLCVPALSHAATVSFEPLKGELKNLRAVSGYEVAGTWSEAGFDVGWHYAGNGPDLADAVTLHTNGAFLADGDCCFGVGRFLEFSRSDGAAFSLKSIGLDYTTSSWLADAHFTPYGSDGALDYSRSRYATFDVFYDNIALSGTRRDGSRVSATASSFEDSIYVSHAGRSSDRLGDGTLEIEDSLAGTLSGLMSLRVELGFGSMAELMARSVARSDLDEIFKLGFAQCAASGQLSQRCSFGGFGEFDFYADSGNYQNWGTAVAFRDFDFTLDGAAPSPVPLPASLPALAAALFGAGLVSRRRRAG